MYLLSLANPTHISGIISAQGIECQNIGVDSDAPPVIHPTSSSQTDGLLLDIMEGTILGDVEGIILGTREGCLDGSSLGTDEGRRLGDVEGVKLGRREG